VASALCRQRPRVIGVNDLELAMEAARAGADVIRPWRLRSVAYKGEVDPVTDADTEAQERILSRISAHRPTDSILAEERAGVAGTEGRWWIVDPLDGTVNFVHGIPHVAVSVALYENGAPLVGVVVDVFRREEFSAAIGDGARLNGRQGFPTIVANAQTSLAQRLPPSCHRCRV
jgi:fructose-1,6-bisphosphatase/inositol monophosphatase family enzyme